MVDEQILFLQFIYFPVFLCSAEDVNRVIVKSAFQKVKKKLNQVPGV